MYNLLRKGSTFRFGETELKTFETLRSKLMSEPILSIYSPFAETELHCDASSIGFGSILLQKQSDGKFHPIFYFSKWTTEYESKFHSYELETLSVVYTLKRSHVYLQGFKFKIVTDCNSFRLTLAKKDIPRIMRWCLVLQNYDYSIEHRSNTRMKHVDALSRVQSVLILEGNTLEQTLAVKQNLDPEIVKIRTNLELSDHPVYELRKGLVIRNLRTIIFHSMCLKIWNIIFYINITIIWVI